MVVYGITATRLHSEWAFSSSCRKAAVWTWCLMSWSAAVSHLVTRELPQLMKSWILSDDVTGWGRGPLLRQADSVPKVGAQTRPQNQEEQRDWRSGRRSLEHPWPLTPAHFLTPPRCVEMKGDQLQCDSSEDERILFCRSTKSSWNLNIIHKV